MAKTEQKSPDEMSFLDHLEELRWHLIRSTLAIVIIACLAFIFKGFIFDTILFGPKNMDFPTYKFFCNIATFFGVTSEFCSESLPFTIQSRLMAGQFSAHIWTSIWAGVIIGFPYILYELWRFISPGLYEKERKSNDSLLDAAINETCAAAHHLAHRRSSLESAEGHQRQAQSLPRWVL